MLSKRYESTEVDRRTWLHVPSGTHWSTSSDTHQVVKLQNETQLNSEFIFLIERLSAPEPKAKVHNCDHTVSVCSLFVRTSSVVKLSHVLLSLYS